MSELTVSLRAPASASYPVVVEKDARPRLVERIRELSPSRVVLVTDENVARLQLAPLRAALAKAKIEPARVESVPPGERSKSLANAEKLYRAFNQANLDRSGLVLALGGGVVGDLAGFAAATWLRGVAVLHAPTTLLAMVDSAIGGKTGVDLEGKNLVGAFHQPSGVFASLDALATLPEREARCGLGEVLKTAVIRGEDLFSRLERDAKSVRALDLDALEPFVLSCLELKAGIVERDEREAGERALLNLGHTLGHALEALRGFSQDLLHGEAVAIGLHFAARLAVRLSLLDSATLERIGALASALGLPLSRGRFSPPRVLELMRKDKKARSGKLRFVLPRAIGRCEIVESVDEELVLEELAAFAAL